MESPSSCSSDDEINNKNGTHLSLCPTITSKILENLRIAETKNRPCHDYMENIQTKINPPKREKCVDWFLNSSNTCLANLFCDNQEILHLAVNYLDRYLSRNNIKGLLQLKLIGATCLFIASKYQKNGSKLKDYLSMKPNKFSANKVLQTERSVLSFLNFEVGRPTAWSFLMAYLVDIRGRKAWNYKAKFIIHISLFEYNVIRFLPSKVAASVIFLTNYVHAPEKNSWNLELKRLTLHEASDLRECVEVLYGVYCKRCPNKLPVIPPEYFQDM